MKFCRFELLAEPGSVRTGMAYEGRIYETDGQEAIGVHEAAEVRLLAPLGRPPALRIFRTGESAFDYANPFAVFGPNTKLMMPPFEGFQVVACLGLVMAAAAERLTPVQADEMILGYTLVASFRGASARGSDLDAGCAVGPVLVTPDEFDDSSSLTELGRSMGGAIAMGEQSALLSTSPITPGQAASLASQTCTLREGDLIALPFLVRTGLEVGDEVRISHPALGVLATRIV